MDLPANQLLDLYRWMVMERLFDESVNSLFRMGKIMSMFHSALGQEAANVGAAYALREGDACIPSHRGKVVYLMRGMPLNDLMAGLFGKREGFGQGRIPVGSHMCGSASMGLLPAEGALGGSLVVGVGAALAMKLRREPNAALIFCGDGASNRGDVHEGMNLASVLKVPAVFFFVNNGWSLSVRASYGLSVERISTRAAGYGLPGVTVDGWRVLEVHGAVSAALRRAREGAGPALVEAVVSRWSAHSVNDPEIYRTDDERREARRRDPVADFEATLVDRGLLSGAEIERIKTECQAALDAGIAFAEGCSEPDEKCLTSGVYGG